MPTSQYLKFVAAVPEDSEFEHPPGAALMRRLATELTAAGWNIINDMDNWRDCGWFIVCRRGSSELEVVVGQIPSEEWVLEVSPRRMPGFISSLFSNIPSATASDVYELALAVHRALSILQYLGSPQWRWDGLPDEKHSTSEPRAA